MVDTMRPRAGIEEKAVISGGTLYLALAFFTSWRLLKCLLGFVGTVTKRFFVDQFIYKWAIRVNPGKAPLVRQIEHPLDARIPIRYEVIELYLSFIQLWISALSYIRRREGRGFNAAILGFMEGLRRCYVDAASVYGRGLTTTRRPARAPSARLAFVYAVDPHLFCVPSLHVLVVCYTYGRLAELLAERGEAERYARELAEVRSRAVAITESILYVRQHSVNCIPTALAMLSVILPSYGEDEAKALMSELWRGEVPETDRAEIVDYMGALYDRVAAPGGLAVYDAIADFVAGYEEMDFGPEPEPELSPAFAGER